MISTMNTNDSEIFLNKFQFKVLIFIFVEPTCRHEWEAMSTSDARRA